MRKTEQSALLVRAFAASATMAAPAWLALLGACAEESSGDLRADGNLPIRRTSDGQILEFVRVPQPTVRALKPLRGDLDMLQGDLPTELVQWIEAREGVRVERRRGTNFAYIGFNMEDSVVGDSRVREAIAHGIDRVGISVDPLSYDWGRFHADVKAGRFLMYSLAWVGIKTPDIFRYAPHSASVPPAGANGGRHRRLRRHLLGELPYVPLWYEGYVFASRDDIVGYHLGEDGAYDGLYTVRRAARAP